MKRADNEQKWNALDSFPAHRDLVEGLLTAKPFTIRNLPRLRLRLHLNEHE